MRKWFGAGLLLLLFVSYVHGAQPPAAGTSYENKALGIKVVFPADWGVYINENNAPDQFKALLRLARKQDNAALFLASHSNKQAFGRLLQETFEGSTIDYFDQLYASMKDKISVVSAQYDARSGVVQWTFVAKAGPADVTFVETITKRGNRVLRLGLWAMTPLSKKYKPTFDEITETTAFLKKEGRQETWEPAWKDIRDDLRGHDIDYVETAKKDPSSSSAVVCKEERKRVLWAVRGKRNTVYLFGSIHVGKPEFYPFEPVTESSFDSSKHLVVEIDATSKDVQGKMARLMAKERLQKGETLCDVLSPAVYRKLSEQVDKMGLPPGTFDNLPPWVTSVGLVVLKMQSMGYMPDYGVDKYFLERAKKGKHIVELESFDEQIGLFKSVGGERFLAFTLIELNSIEAQTEKMINAWQCGDLKTMEEITFQVGPGLIDNIDQVYDKLYYARNRKMVGKIKKFLLDKDDYFVVVGSGHLIGDKGIVALLKKAGYQVSRL